VSATTTHLTVYIERMNDQDASEISQVGNLIMR
jgi:hypothetical protein